MQGTKKEGRRQRREHSQRGPQQDEDHAQEGHDAESGDGNHEHEGTLTGEADDQHDATTPRPGVRATPNPSLNVDENMRGGTR